MIHYGSNAHYLPHGEQRRAYPDPPGLKEQWMEQQGIAHDSPQPSRVSAVMKTCRKCGRLLPLDQFHADRSKSDGHRSACIDCTRAYDRERRRERRK